MLSILAMEKRKMGLVSELPAVYLQTLSSDSRDSPPEMSRTCFSWGMLQVVSTATLRCPTVSRARPISRVTMAPVSTRNMYSIFLPFYHRYLTMWMSYFVITLKSAEIIYKCDVIVII